MMGKVQKSNNTNASSSEPFWIYIKCNIFISVSEMEELEQQKYL
jgi:hypothetical protein